MPAFSLCSIGDHSCSPECLQKQEVFRVSGRQAVIFLFLFFDLQTRSESQYCLVVQVASVVAGLASGYLLKRDAFLLHVLYSLDILQCDM